MDGDINTISIRIKADVGEYEVRFVKADGFDGFRGGGCNGASCPTNSRALRTSSAISHSSSTTTTRMAPLLTHECTPPKKAPL
jgi:hypothetical protein